MLEYPKIDTLLARDKETFKVTKELRRPEFNAVTEWFMTEKVDGTNVRIDFRLDGDTIGWQYGGRTPRAELHKDLITVIEETADGIESEVIKIFEEYELKSYTLFMEGYGAGIQKGGALSFEKRVILYDVLVNDHTWLGVQDVINAGARLGIRVVPTFPNGVGLNTITALVIDGMQSVVADEFGIAGTISEGVVCHPLHPLFDGRGRRVCFKLKTKDFGPNFKSLPMVG